MGYNKCVPEPDLVPNRLLGSSEMPRYHVQQDVDKSKI